MIGWIIYNGNLMSDKIYELVEWLRDTGLKKNLELIPVRNSDLLFYFDRLGQPKMKHPTLSMPNFVISWDKDIPLAEHFEKMGIRVFNSSAGIHVCDNKVMMHQALSNQNLPLPKTIIAPMVFSNCDIKLFTIYEGIIELLGFPLIIKEAYGSFGQQVYMVHNYDELIDQVKTIGNKPHLFQEYIKSSHGKDVRINVVDNKVIASMLRTSETDFRANITAGGKATAYEPSEAEKEVAIKVCQILNLDFAGVDLLFGPDGPILCEVNGNPHFKSVYEATGIDVSESIIDYIIEALKC